MNELLVHLMSISTLQGWLSFKSSGGTAASVIAITSCGVQKVKNVSEKSVIVYAIRALRSRPAFKTQTNAVGRAGRARDKCAAVRRPIHRAAPLSVT
jgi:hypothetical protein